MSFEGLWFTFLIFLGSLGLGGGGQRGALTLTV